MSQEINNDVPDELKMKRVAAGLLMNSGTDIMDEIISLSDIEMDLEKRKIDYQNKLQNTQNVNEIEQIKFNITQLDIQLAECSSRFEILIQRQNNLINCLESLKSKK